MNALHHWQSFLQARTKREKILFLVAIYLLLYALIFHSFFLSTLQNITELTEKQNQAYLQNNQNTNIAQSLQQLQNTNQKLKTLITLLNAKAMSYPQAIESIHTHAQDLGLVFETMHSSHQSQHYLITLGGNAPLEQLFLFLDFVENLPLIHIHHFTITPNQSFSLTLKHHSIFPSEINPSLTLKGVLKHLKLSLHKTPIQPLHQIKTRTLVLEAIFNQKAKINGKWVQKGDRIHPFTILSITENSVTLKSTTETLQLTFQNPRIFQ